MDRYNAYLIDENLIIAAEKGDVKSIKKCQTDYIDSATAKPMPSYALYRA